MVITRSGLQTKEIVKEQGNPVVTGDSLQENAEVEDKEKEASEEIRVEKKTIPLSFPQRARKHQEEASFKKFLDLLKQVHVNISHVDILQSVPKYAKYLKDIDANKNRLAEYATVSLTQECTSKIQNKLATKLKDSGSFTLEITLGQTICAHGLCDLGASINLMPTSWYRKMGFGSPKPTTTVLKLADRSLARPDNVIEDVLIQVEFLIFPMDFVILDFEADPVVPFILGQPFLATTQSLI
ncbi:uncharacterized protein LOC107839034 [Capsicum annuum]|uniref:uncharacterized protein LOC107839034 n=1 Tax=Capsicum annuum TaxID=4072 RepID=UPI001FB0A7C3|nr:uncharacterized protein LOC107839034 [Capsicum annuum]